MAAATKVRTTESGIMSTGEYGYPTGHLGHLTDAQEKLLVAFKQLCEEKGLFKPASDKSQSSHDDATLLRFLRARRFVPQDALQQFRETEKWRDLNQIGPLYENIDIKDYEETRKLYPQWTGRRDKRGLPVYVFEVAPLNSKTMSAYAKASASTSIINVVPKASSKEATPGRLLRLFALYENLTRFIMPLCSALKDRPHGETPISQSSNIVDISNVGLKQFWNLRTHMQDASQLATAHYPETLDRIFVIGAPSFFPTVWSWIKSWFDPITTSKIFILSKQDAYRTLSTFIEPANIPKKYGGELDYKFGMAPVLDPAEEQHFVWKNPDPVLSNQKWPKGPMKWVLGDDPATLVAIAVGSIDGKERREVVGTFHIDGKDNFVSSMLAAQAADFIIASDDIPAPVSEIAAPTTDNIPVTGISAAAVGQTFSTSEPVPTTEPTNPATGSLPTTINNGTLISSVNKQAIETPLPPQGKVERVVIANGTT